MHRLKRTYFAIAVAALLFLPKTHNASCLHLTKTSKEIFPKHIVEITEQFSLLEKMWSQKNSNLKQEVIPRCEAIKLLTSNLLTSKSEAFFNKKLGTFEKVLFTPDVALFTMLLTAIYHDAQKTRNFLDVGIYNDKKFNKLKISINSLKNILEKETSEKIDVCKNDEFKKLFQTVDNFHSALKCLHGGLKSTNKETNPDIRRAFSRSWSLIVMIWANSIEVDAQKCLKIQKKSPDFYQRALALRIKYCAQKLQKRESITHTLSDLDEAKSMIDALNLFRTKS